MSIGIGLGEAGGLANGVGVAGARTGELGPESGLTAVGNTIPSVAEGQGPHAAVRNTRQTMALSLQRKQRDEVTVFPPKLYLHERYVSQTAGERPRFQMWLTIQ